MNPIRSTESRYLFPFDMCLSPSYTSPQPFSSLQMLSLHPTIRCYSQQLSHPHVHVLRRLPLTPGAASATFVYASACTAIKSEKKISLSRFYPLLITCDTSRDEKSNACQNAGPLVSFEEETPRCFAFFVFFALPLTLVKSHRQIILSSKRKKM